MKIYFTASARGKINYKSLYEKIYGLIRELGHENLDDLLLKIDPQKFYLGNQKQQIDLYKKTTGNIKKADIIVLEVSIPSLSMGYVMNKSLDEGKPVILLSLESSEGPYFAQGIQNERLQIITYTEDNLKKTLKEAIEVAKEQMDVRFNFFISPKIGSYLDWICKTKKIPRAVYLRGLIEREMKENKKDNSR